MATISGMQKAMTYGVLHIDHRTMGRLVAEVDPQTHHFFSVGNSGGNDRDCSASAAAWSAPRR
jgi:hypothetical protein